MANHFNELLLQTLKEVGIRLERLEGRVDHVINEKSDKADVKDVKADVKDVKENLTALREEVRSNGQRLDRIETGIRTLQWTMTAGIAVMGIILAFVKAC